MKILVIRMSSLGDILLSLSFLESLPESAKVDWVVSNEFSFLLEGHPKIDRVIPFQKGTGLKGWIRLIQELSRESYSARVDLHRTLRSRIAFVLFRLSDISHFKFTSNFSISKERVRSLLNFTLKGVLPVVLKPTPYWKRFARLALKVSGAKEIRPPSYLSVLSNANVDEDSVLKEYALEPKKYYGVMPASRWASKEWGSDHYFELVKQMQSSGLTPVLLGRENDLSCQEVCGRLRATQIPFQSALSEPDFKKTAILLKNAKFYVGGDTGLAHLAEAVGTPSHVIFGPTRPSVGFGPWRKESDAVFIPLACSPCSKDGKFCYRFGDRYACLKKLPVDVVRKSLS